MMMIKQLVMNWFDLVEWSQYEKERLKTIKYEQTIQAQVDTIDTLGKTISRLKKLVDDQADELDSLIPLPVTERQASDFFRSVVQFHKWDGKTNRPMHESLDHFTGDTAKLETFRKFLNKIGAGYYEDVDACVYGTTKKVLDYINNRYDKDEFEHWPDPMQALEFYESGVLDDCDGARALLWGALTTSLIRSGFSTQIWRLKCVDIGITAGPRHAVLTWIKDDGTFALIETTYVADNFTKMWFNNKDLMKSCYIAVLAIFDELSEYKLK